MFKERERKNIDVGKFLLKRLETEASGGEVDKYKLHVAEVDKITSLILSLASRLSRTEIGLINLKQNWSEDEEVWLRLHRFLQVASLLQNCRPYAISFYCNYWYKTRLTIETKSC